MMPVTYDCIVLGVGGFGSAALYHLARRGVRALGIEQFGVAHDRGSSHGETRIIRKAYFEHPDYVPLLHRTYELWHELESETGRQLYHPAGLLIAGPPEGEAVAGTLLAARQHHLSVDELTAGEAQTRFSGYRMPDHFRAVFEEKAGYLEVENCVSTLIARAVELGATLAPHERVLSWENDGQTIRVRTDKNTYAAPRMVVTAGPWAGEILRDLNLPLDVVRKPVFWFPASAKYDVASGNSTFLFDMPDGMFYGFPRLDGQTIKAAEHTGGAHISDPLTVDRLQQPDDLARLSRFVDECLPEVDPRPVRHSVCMYTRTPDCNFIIDRHPQYPNVAFGAGFSGHGFKFTQVLGDVLVDLALDGKTDQPVGFLSLERFGVT